MTQEIPPIEAFESVRSRLFGLAYRMLGSRTDAEDVVQDTYLRWHRADRAVVENPEAWLVTVATRLSIDRLRRLKTEREAYVGPWLPEPILPEHAMPERDLELSSDLSMAMLTVLETLAPDERAAFLLHDVFDVEYPQIAAILGRNAAACRQVVHRARQRVRGSRRFDATASAKLALLQQFKAGVDVGDEKALIEIFAADATWTADGGGRTPASPTPLVGVERIVRLLMGLRRKLWLGLVLEITTVNGEPGLTIRDDGRMVAVLAIDTADGRIAAVYAVINPDKLPSPRR